MALAEAGRSLRCSSCQHSSAVPIMLMIAYSFWRMWAREMWCSCQASADRCAGFNLHRRRQRKVSPMVGGARARAWRIGIITLRHIRLTYYIYAARQNARIDICIRRHPSHVPVVHMCFGDFIYGNRKLHRRQLTTRHLSNAVPIRCCNRPTINLDRVILMRR